MSLSTLTIVHVALSLVGLVSGAVVLRAMLRSRMSAPVTALFLLTTMATSLTGFVYPLTRIGLGQVVGVLCLLVVVPALLALYSFRLTGRWRAVYAAGATAALYLNAVIAVAQLFKKVAVLQPLMPSLTAPAFLAAQAVLLAVFVVLGEHAVRRFHPSLPRLGQPRRFPRRGDVTALT